MKKIFDFGKIDYTGTGRKVYPVTVEMEYREKDNGEKVLSIHALFRREPSRTLRESTSLWGRCRHPGEWRTALAAGLQHLAFAIPESCPPA